MIVDIECVDNKLSWSLSNILFWYELLRWS